VQIDHLGQWLAEEIGLTHLQTTRNQNLM
jgi:hypothetical protein